MIDNAKRTRRVHACREVHDPVGSHGRAVQKSRQELAQSSEGRKWRAPFRSMGRWQRRGFSCSRWVDCRGVERLGRSHVGRKRGRTRTEPRGGGGGPETGRGSDRRTGRGLRPGWTRRLDPCSFRPSRFGLKYAVITGLSSERPGALSTPDELDTPGPFARFGGALARKPVNFGKKGLVAVRR